MFCSYCGTLCEDDAIFCPSCGKVVLLQDDAALPEIAPNETFQSDDAAQAFPEVPVEAVPESTPGQAAQDASTMEPFIPFSASEKTAPVSWSEKKPPRTGGLKAACVVLSVVAVLAVAVAVYFFTTFQELRVNLSINQTERASAEAEVLALSGQLTTMEGTLEQLKSERDSLSGQVKDLTGQINSMESDVSQSTFDRESAQRELAQAQADVSALSGQITEIQGQLTQAQTDLENAQNDYTALQGDYKTLEESQKTLEKETEFYDTYVVFVMLSSDEKYYHKYDCEEFTKRNFLAYSTKLAEANGYSKCPKCN